MSVDFKTSNQLNCTSYFYSLDILRGLASLAVVFWHWKHFFYIGGCLGQFNLNDQPLYPIFKQLYTNGWRAVDIFFCLSGFVFFWLYDLKIAHRKISPRQFFYFRFSRLYPLHFLTLVLVICGQYLYLHKFSYYFVYQDNDIFHFILQAFMASSWGFEKNLSFNGPAWSVSVEILCYVVFYMFAFYKLNRFILIALFVFILTFLLHKHGESHIYRGLMNFFVGGISFKLFLFFLNIKIKYNKTYIAVFFAIILWIIIPIIENHSGEYYTIYLQKLGTGYFIFPGKSVIGYAVFILSEFSYELILFPWTIITLALIDTQRIKLLNYFAFLGHISYSSYLLHFPLQLFFMLVTSYFSIDQKFFYSRLSLFLFFLCLIPLSFCSYRYFEYPIQKYLRSKN